MPETDTTTTTSPAISDLERIRSNIAYLVKYAAAPGRCAYCGVAIVWIKHRSGAATPYHADDLTPHLIQCKAERFKAFKKQYQLT